MVLPFNLWLLMLLWLGLWWGLNGADAASLSLGVTTVALATWLSRALPRFPPWRVQPLALLGFLPRFAWWGVLAGVDVARRVCRREMRCQPGVIAYHPYLPAGIARLILLQYINLQPGTASVGLRHGTLHILVLDTTVDNAAQARRLEDDIAQIFGFTPLAARAPAHRRGRP